MFVILALFELWKEGLQRCFRIAYKAVVEFGTPAELFSAEINLDYCRMLGKELLVWKVRSNHQQNLAVHHRAIAGRKSEQAGHTDVKRVVVLDEFFPAHRMHDRGLKLAGKLD